MNNKTECGCSSCSNQLCTKKVPIFSALNELELNSMTSLIEHKVYKKGEVLFGEGSHLDSLFIINNGQVKAYKYSLEGKEQILYIFSEGDFFGEKNLLRDQEAPYYTEALELTRACKISKKDFRNLLNEYPEIGLKIIEALSERIEGLENTIQNMGTKSTETRMNLALLEFARKFGKETKKGVLVELPLSREGIANYIGVTRETVSRKLSLLQDEGVIEIIGNKKILILDMDILEDSY